MKYEETYPGVQAEVLDSIKNIVPEVFTRSLEDAGLALTLPQDTEMELKVKYDVSEEGGSLTLKVVWDNEVEEEEEEEEEEDKEDD